jgi:hypothetical protein
MSSLSVLSVAVRPSVARVGVVGIFAVLLVGVGFLVPFWMVAAAGGGCVAGAAAVRKVRHAAHTIDRILGEELGPRAQDQ